MTPEFIILIIGGVLMLMALGDSINITGKSLNLFSPKIRIPIGIVGILLLIYGGSSYGAVNYQVPLEQVEVGEKLQVKYPVENVQVIYPVADDSVSCRTLTMGVYPDRHEKDIWVLLKPADNKYYPQSDHTNTSYKRNNEWQVITRFGGDKGESYEVIIYETDAKTSEFFSNTIQEWKENDSYPGLQPEEIPSGASEVDRIVVLLKENCRGVF